MIIGVNLESIEAKKLTTPKGSIRIDNNTTIKAINEISVPIVKEKVNKIDFKFQTRYAQEKKQVGTIIIEGNVIYKGNRAEIKKRWKKEKKMPESVAMEIMNVVLRKCLIKAVDLSEQIMLPPPIVLPIIRPKKEQNIEYIA